MAGFRWKLSTFCSLEYGERRRMRRRLRERERVGIWDLKWEKYEAYESAIYLSVGQITLFLSLVHRKCNISKTKTLLQFFSLVPTFPHFETRCFSAVHYILTSICMYNILYSICMYCQIANSGAAKLCLDLSTWIECDMRCVYEQFCLVFDTDTITREAMFNGHKTTLDKKLFIEHFHRHQKLVSLSCSQSLSLLLIHLYSVCVLLQLTMN